MQTMLIESSNQNKLSEFLTKILLLDQKPLSDYAMGKTLLDILSNIFGYDETALWIKRPNESYYSLSAYRVNDSLIDSYNDEFYQSDPLNPSKIIGKTDILDKKNVVTIKDIMPYHEFLETRYYREFLKKENYHYETVIYLRYKDEVIGCLGILKKNYEKDFTEDELIFMNTLSYFLSVFTKKHFSECSLVENKNLYESISNQSPIGIMVFDINAPFTIRYINSSALRYTSEFVSDYDIQMPGESFIAKYIQNDISYKQFGVTKIIQSIKNRSYFINAVPSQSMDSNSLMMYVYIVPQNGIDNIIKPPYNETSANLTDRQLEIINCVLQGKTNNEIARELFISVNTVKTHLNNIYKELNVVNRLGLYSKLLNE